MITPQQALQLSDREQTIQDQVEFEIDRNLRAGYQGGNSSVRVFIRKSTPQRVRASLVQRYSAAGWVIRQQQYPSGRLAWLFSTNPPAEGEPRVEVGTVTRAAPPTPQQVAQSRTRAIDLSPHELPPEESGNSQPTIGARNGDQREDDP